MASTPITEFSVSPTYYTGFKYTWNVNTTLSDPLPWIFTIEQSETPYEKFGAISPGLVNLYQYQEITRRMISKDGVLHFRLKMVTPVATYYSEVIDPHAQLSKSDFLIVRKIMHDEYIGQRNMVGVTVDYWVRSSFGPVCTCVDPITKDVLNSDCPLCYGVGRQPGYHGPYTTWCTFSPVQKQKGLADDNSGPASNYAITGRLTAVSELKKDDVIVDKTNGRCYYIDAISNVAELRRIPIAQNVVLKQIPTSSPIYKLAI